MLGTANFGNPYGYAQSLNPVPKVGEKQAHKILGEAKDLGINTLECALSYGVANEYVIGSGIEEHFEIWLKISNNNNFKLKDEDYNKPADEIFSQFPCFSRINVISIHNWRVRKEDRDFEDKALMRLKKSNFEIGVSLYGPLALESALNVKEFKLIQFEYNIFRQHCHGNFINKGSKIFAARSIFMQGLLAKASNPIPPKLSEMIPRLKMFHDLCKSWNMQPMEVCLRFALSETDLDHIVVGVDSTKELEDIVTAEHQGPLEGEQMEILRRLDFSNSPLSDPRNW